MMNINFQQHDSHEFLINLLELLEDELKKEYKTNPSSILGIELNELMSNIFDTTVSSIIYCEETNEPIGIKRLEARPIATLSLEAQERHERMEKIYLED